ncbi:MAG: NADH-quinone oxidoreductase subunit A [Acidobacteriota bacterium]
MLYNYWTLVLILLVSIIFVYIAFFLSKILQKKKKAFEKYIAYECGVNPETDSRDRYSIKYYLIALLFIIFDIETVFLFPWAIIYDRLALFGFLEMLIFLGILIVGYFWVWRKGALKYGAE